MSALLHIGAADHNVLNADAELCAALRQPLDPIATECVRRAVVQLSFVRADLGAVRLLLRSQGFAELLAYHETMEARLRLGAAAMRGVLNNPLAANADMHAQRAKLLRDLLGGTNGDR